MKLKFKYVAGRYWNGIENKDDWSKHLSLCPKVFHEYFDDEGSEFTLETYETPGWSRVRINSGVDDTITVDGDEVVFPIRTAIRIRQILRECGTFYVGVVKFSRVDK